MNNSTGLLDFMGEEEGMFPDNSSIAQTISTRETFFKPGITFKKFFNVSIPIEEKINLALFEDKHNLTDKFNQVKWRRLHVS